MIKSLEKATNEFLNCGEKKSRAKVKLEEKVADAKSAVRMAKRDGLDVERLIEKIMAAQEALKASALAHASASAASEATNSASTGELGLRGEQTFLNIDDAL